MHGPKRTRAWDRAPDPARQAVMAKPSLLAVPAAQDCPYLGPQVWAFGVHANIFRA